MTMTRTRQLVFGGAAGLGILMGAAGISAAATGTSHQAPPAASTTKAATPPEKADNETSDSPDEANGVNCEDGIIKATGAQCDGGPAANKANDPAEAGQAKESDKESGKEEADSTEKADGIDHQAEGNEVGENGNGIPDAHDAAEAAGANG